MMRLNDSYGAAMTDSISKNHDKIWVAGMYYIPAVLLYVINMFIPAVRPGVCATLLMACVAAELIIRRQFVLRTFIDRLVAVYILYNALSVIWLLKSGKPFSVYSGEFVVSLLPMIFYFAGRSCSGNDHKTDDGDRAGYFHRNFIIAVLITGILGMILQITMPRFYIDYLYNYETSTCDDPENNGQNYISNDKLYLSIILALTSSS